MEKPNIQFDFDEKADVLHISLGTGEPSYCEEVDDIVLVERGFFSHQITGFQIMDIRLHNIKKVELLQVIEEVADKVQSQLQKQVAKNSRIPSLIDRDLKWREIMAKRAAC